MLTWNHGLRHRENEKSIVRMYRGVTGRDLSNECLERNLYNCTYRACVLRCQTEAISTVLWSFVRCSKSLITSDVVCVLAIDIHPCHRLHTQ